MSRLLGLVGRALRGLGRQCSLLELAQTGRQLDVQPFGGGVQRRRLAADEVRPHRGGGVALLQRGETFIESGQVLLLACGGPGHQLGTRLHLGGRLFGRVVAQDVAPAVAEGLLFAVEGSQFGGEARLVGPGRGRFGGGDGDLGRQAGGLGFQGRDDVDVGVGIEGGHDGPAALAQDSRRAAGPLNQALDSTQRAGQVLLAPGGQLGRSGRGLGVEGLERLVELQLLVPADAQVPGGGAVALGELGQLGPGQVAADGQKLGGHRVMGPGGGSLAFERADLAPHLPHQVTEPLEVLGRGGQPAFGSLTPAAMLEDAGGLLDDGPAILGPGVEHGIELALTDDHVLLAAHARVREQLGDVQQPAGGTVDGVLRVTAAKEGPGDGHLGQVDRELARRVVDGERHLGPSERRARRGPGENDVLHLRRAKRARSLCAQDPGDGVDDVGLAAPVGPDHHGDARLELEHGGIGEGFEPLHAERLQEHRGDPTGSSPRVEASGVAGWRGVAGS